MKALIFSDSHGRVRPMVDAVGVYGADVIFHLGDKVRDGERLREAYPGIPFYQVAGNCDFMDPGDYPTEGVARLDGKTIFYLHGHTQQVKTGLDRALMKGDAMGADILLFGHTHRYLYRDYEGLLAVNPGAAQDGSAILLMWKAGGEVDHLPISL